MGAATIIYGFTVEPDEKYDGPWCDSVWKKLGFRVPLKYNSMSLNGEFGMLEAMIGALSIRRGWEWIDMAGPEDAVVPLLVVGAILLSTEDVSSFDIRTMNVSPEKRKKLGKLSRVIGANAPTYTLVAE